MEPLIETIITNPPNSEKETHFLWGGRHFFVNTFNSTKKKSIVGAPKNRRTLPIYEKNERQDFEQAQLQCF